MVYFYCLFFWIGALMYTVNDHCSSELWHLGPRLAFPPYSSKIGLIAFLPVLQVGRNVKKGAEIQDFLILAFIRRFQDKTWLIFKIWFSMADVFVKGNWSLLGQKWTLRIANDFGLGLILLFILSCPIIKKRHEFLFLIY